MFGGGDAAWGQALQQQQPPQPAQPILGATPAPFPTGLFGSLPAPVPGGMFGQPQQQQHPLMFGGGGGFFGGQLGQSQPPHQPQVWSISLYSVDQGPYGPNPDFGNQHPPSDEPQSAEILSMDVDTPPSSLSPDFSPSVPWEIVLAIVRETEDPSTLASFSLVCYPLLKVAGPLLWRDLLVDSYFKMACLFHEPSPPPPITSRLHLYLGFRHLLNLHFNLPPPPSNPLLHDPRLRLPRSRLPNPSFHLPINHLILEWRANEPVDYQLNVFAHLNPKTYSQIYTPEKEDAFYDIVNSDQLWMMNAFMRWSRLFKTSSSGVLHCEKIFIPGFENSRVWLPFTGGTYEKKPYLVFDFRRSAREGFGERARMAGFDEEEAWLGLVRELDIRGIGECKEVGDGGVEILVSEKGDEERLLAVLSRFEGNTEQRRKYKVTLGDEFDIHHHIGPDTRRPAPPRPPPIVIGGH